MKIFNLDAGVHRAVKAQFVAKGASSQVAHDKATKHLDAACKLFHEKFKEGPFAELGSERPAAVGRNETACYTHAMRAVVTWARAL